MIKKLLTKKIISLFIRGGIVCVLENIFVPMKKRDRFEWEKFLLGAKWFPFKQLIFDCWHKEIKSKHPLIGSWVDDYTI
jgi:hypothetical protein